MASFNYGGNTPPENQIKKTTIIVGLIFIVIEILIFIILFVVNLIVAQVTIDINVIISIIALTISVSTTILYFIEKNNNNLLRAKKEIEIVTSIEKNDIVFYCLLKNIGIKRIINENVYLVITSGKLVNNIYDFGSNREVKNNSNSIYGNYCIYSKIIKNSEIPHERYLDKDNDEKYILLNEEFSTNTKNIINEYNNHIRNYEYFIISLAENFSDRFKFIDPSEKLTGSRVFNLKKGMYRVMVIWMIDDKECLCDYKYFKI